jgi:hypothetical protein
MIRREIDDEIGDGRCTMRWEMDDGRWELDDEIDDG